MKDGLRQTMAWLHGWSGVIAGWILYAVFVSGTLSYFRHEISLWMRPELSASRPRPDAIAQALRMLQTRAADSPRWLIDAPQSNQPTLRIGWSIAPAPGTPGSLLRRFESLELNPLTGEELHARSTRGGDFFYQFHSDLSMQPVWGRWIVGTCAMFMLVAIVSGIVTHRNIFKNFFTFRPGKGPRSWLDAHNVVGVVALPYHVMITYTGLVTLMLMYMPAAVQANYGFDSGAFLAEVFPYRAPSEATGQPGKLVAIEPLLREASRRWDGAMPAQLNIEHPNDAGARIQMRRSDAGRVSANEQTIVFDGSNGEVLSATSAEPGAMRVYGFLKGLHLARFSPVTLRFMFAFCGLLGAAMVATGLILWSAKRASSIDGSRLQSWNYRVLRILNIGTIAGMWLGIAAYFWANRLLPVDLAFRSVWEVRCFFLVWAMSYVAAALQPASRAWSMQFALGAVSFALLPVVNAMTTITHFGNSLRQGLWIYAGFDLSALAIAATLGIAAWCSAPASEAKHSNCESAPSCS